MHYDNETIIILELLQMMAGPYRFKIRCDSVIHNYYGVLETILYKNYRFNLEIIT